MYIPKHFKEEDPARLEALVTDYAFGLLVTHDGGAPFATHLPLLFDRGKGSKGTLTGHMARSNPQWRHFREEEPVLAVFQGPHAYVSPAWYASPGVPTWNYAVVHIYGTPSVIEEPEALRAIVERLTSVHEARFPQPWQPDLSDDKTAPMLRMIVGFEIEVTEVQGKFKLSQNRSAEDQRLVIERLGADEASLDAAVSRLMAANRK